MKTDLLPCGHCGGTGHIELTGVYADTLALLRRNYAGVSGMGTTGAELAKIAGCAATAMNNRLAALERYGFATSRWYGRKRFYKAVRK